MKIKFVIIGLVAFLFLLVINSSAEGGGCVIPFDDMTISEDTTFCQGTYNIPNGITIGANNINLDCGNSTLIGPIPQTDYLTGCGWWHKEDCQAVLVCNQQEINFCNLYGSGIKLDGRIGVTIKNCNIKQFSNSIEMVNSDSNTFQSNEVELYGMGYGAFYLINSDYNLLENNKVHSKPTGWNVGHFFLRNSDYNTFKDNYGIRDHTMGTPVVSGFHIGDGSLEGSDYNNILNNSIEGEQLGMYTNRANNNIMAGNTLINTTFSGIYIGPNSINNQVKYNNIRNNLKYGVFVETANNEIKENNFCNNKAYNIYNWPSSNVLADKNWFGTINESEIEEKIYDYNDNPDSGLVTFKPYLGEPYGSCTPEWSLGDWESCQPDDYKYASYEDINCCGKNKPEEEKQTCDFCTPNWVETNGTCTNDSMVVSYVDTNDCFAQTGLESDNNPPENYTTTCDDDTTPPEIVSVEYPTNVNVSGYDKIIITTYDEGGLGTIYTARYCKKIGVLSPFSKGYSYGSQNGGAILALYPSEKYLCRGSEIVLTINVTDYDQDTENDTLSTYAEYLIHVNNNIPTIDSYTPMETNLSLHVGESLLFEHASSDLDEDSLTYSWRLDSVEQATTSSWTFSPDYESSGTHNVTLVVSDGAETDSQEWTIVYTNCLIPTGDMAITKNVTLCPGDYFLPQGIKISDDTVVLDCDGAKIYGDYSKNGQKEIGVNISSSSSVTVKNCIIDNYYTGIESINSDNLIIKDNQLRPESGNTALYFKDVTQSTIKNNLIRGTTYVGGDSYNNLLFDNTHNVGEVLGAAIYFISTSHNNTVIGSTFSNTYDGVDLQYGTYNNLIEDNTFKNNNRAIIIAGSDDHTIRNNTITALNPPPEYTGLKGIVIADSSTSGNKIHSNKISGMNTCIAVKETSDNLVYNNNFFDCNIYAEDANSSTWVKNYWESFDEPSEGCFDSDLNNICDNQFVIDTDSQDVAPSNLPREYANVVLYPIDNIIAKEGDLITLNASVVGKEEDGVNYTVNDSKFNQSENIFSWQTNYSDEGTYIVKITASDENYEDSQKIEIIINNTDTLVGSLNNILSNLKNLSLTINGLTELDQTFSGEQEVVFNDGDNPLIKFVWNFDLACLNLNNLTINKQEENSSEGFLIISGLSKLLPEGTTKTVYIDDLNETINSVCILDNELSSISEISENCNQENESLITCDGTEQNNYSCTDLGNIYKVTGLKHSGVKEGTCSESWSCTDWSACSDGIQTRTCTDLNSCGTANSKPAESQSCSSGGSSGGGGSGGGGGGGGGSSSTPSVTSQTSNQETPVITPSIVYTPTKTSSSGQETTEETQEQMPEDLTKKESVTLPQGKTSSLIAGATTGIFDTKSIKNDPLAIAVILFFVALMVVFVYELIHKGIIKKEERFIRNWLKKKRVKILGILFVVAIIAFAISSFIRFENTKYDSFAGCLTEKDFIFYGSSDTKGTTIQKETFGDSFDKIKYINCIEELQKCKNEKIVTVPSWKTINTIYEGPQSLEELSGLSNCSIR